MTRLISRRHMLEERSRKGIAENPFAGGKPSMAIRLTWAEVLSATP